MYRMNRIFQAYGTTSGKGIAPSYFSNLHNLGAERDTTKELEMNSIDICSINLIECVFIVPLHVFN